MGKRIYLDNAATSWPKPESVYQAVDQYQRESGATVSRSTSATAETLQKTINLLRMELKRFLGAAAGTEVVFAQNGTDALNLAFHGLLAPGDHVVTTTAEHNSVLRPLRWLEDHRNIRVTRVRCDERGMVESRQIEQALLPQTKLVSLVGTSNVTGFSNPITDIGKIISPSNSLFLVDAAQTVGHRKIDMQESKIDLLAFPGHKGLLGPLGTGCLLVGTKAQHQMNPIRQGGTGASSDSDHHPRDFPHGFEPGSPNIPGLIGLGAGLHFLQQTGLDTIGRHVAHITAALARQLMSLSNIQLYPAEPELTGLPNHLESGILSLNHSHLAPQEFAGILDSSFGIQTRAGHHCASLIHEPIGCPQGCVRLSLGYFNQMADVEATLRAIREISATV